MNESLDRPLHMLVSNSKVQRIVIKRISNCAGVTVNRLSSEESYYSLLTRWSPGCVSIKDLFWSLLLLQWKKRSLHSLSVGCNQYLLQNAHPLTNKLDWNENLMDGEWDCDKDWGQQLRKTTVLVQLSLRLPIGGVCCIVLVCTQQPMTLAKIKSTILLFHPNEWTSWWIRYAMCILINYHLLMNNTSRGIESSDDCLASGMPW